MKTDIQGCSTCPIGGEQYEDYINFSGRPMVQYDYRDTDGKLFSTVASSLESARSKRDLWLKRRNDGRKTSVSPAG